jgi:hypothetical protein
MTGRTAGQLGVNYPWTLEKRAFILPILRDPQFAEIMALLESSEANTRRFSESRDLNSRAIQL